MSSAADRAVERILKDAMEKYRAGELKHGPLNITTDPRNFLKEAEGELLDRIVYTAFEIWRIRRLSDRLDRTLEGMEARLSGRCRCFEGGGKDGRVQP